MTRNDSNLNHASRNETGFKNKPLNVSQAAKFLDVSESHIYKLTHNRKIPFYKKGKRNYFKISDLEQWAYSNRVKPQDEIEAEAANFCVNRLGKR